MAGRHGLATDSLLCLAEGGADHEDTTELSPTWGVAAEMRILAAFLSFHFHLKERKKLFRDGLKLFDYCGFY
jgi:hypothetical protein